MSPLAAKISNLHVHLGVASPFEIFELGIRAYTVVSAESTWPRKPASVCHKKPVYRVPFDGGFKDTL